MESKYPNLNRLILEEDRELRIFLSGGRVRVIRDREDHGDNFYGEGANIYECLRQAEENCILGLPYEEGYQKEGHPFTGYLTGESAVDYIDASLFNHGRIYIRKIDNEVWLITHASSSHPVPVISGVNLEDAIEKFNRAIKDVYRIPYYDDLRR